jgi:hypothetical protein
LILTSEAKTTVDVAKQLNSQREDPISAKTVARALVKADFKSKKKIKRPKLSAKNIKARYQWALKHEHWTVEDWKSVIFSDETKMCLYESDGVIWAWVPKDDKLSSAQIIPTVKFGGGCVMVHGVMSWWGVGLMQRIVGTMDRYQYIRLLTHGLLPLLDAISIVPGAPTRDQIWFQQDNDPKHTSAAVRQFFMEQNIQVLDWPSQSPDMNIIEHLWRNVKRRKAQRKVQPKGVEGNWQASLEEWNKTTVEECQRLYMSMPDRVRALKQAKGRNTKY